MAKIKFMLQSKSDASNIYVRYSINRTLSLKRKVGLLIDYRDWNPKKEQSDKKHNDARNLNISLSKLKTHLEVSYNTAITSGTAFTGEWLQQQIDLFNKSKPIVELDILTNYVQKFINEAPFKQNQQKELGLSTGRVANLKLFKKNNNTL